MKHKPIVPMFCLLLAAKAVAMDVIDPTGLNYSNISDSSSYDGSYTSANLFNYNVSGVLTDTQVQDGTEYARNGAGDCFVAFQLDKNYTNVSSVFYAQRNGYNASLDKVSTISVWTSPSTPFAAADPGIAPEALTGTLSTDGAIWKEYALNKSVKGQYFLLKLSSTGGGNPGGRELRLGGNLGLAPTLVQSPGDKTLYAGVTAHLSVLAGGVGLVYQWSKDGTALSNGGRISGGNSPDLAISGLVAGDAGNYACFVSNNSGSFSTTSHLTLTSLPSNAAALAVLSNSPAAYWQLNESAGSTIASDSVGGFNGTFGTTTGVGAGPQSPTFMGFPSDNSGVQTANFDSNSVVALPPLNLVGSNGVTITAWIKSSGFQYGYSGIVFGRGVGTASGLICSADGSRLAYQWGGNGYDFNSGLDLPADEWCMVALVYSADKVVLYRSSGDTMVSVTDNSARPVQKFNCTTYIGWDTDSPASDKRTFQGGVDDVAFFDHALSEPQIDAVFAAGRGTVQLIPIEITSQPTTNQSVFLGSPYSLSVVATGTTPHYQWFQNNAPIAGATNSIFAVTNATSANLGQYYVVVSNSVNTVASSVFVARAADVLSPTGVIYSNISDDNHYNEGYVAANMFEHDMTDVPVGTFLQNDPVEFARQGDGSCFVAFELGQVYTNVGSVLYAPRYGSPDQMSQMSIWTSKTQAFTAGDPGTAPDAIVPLIVNAGAYWKGYSLNSILSGRYFLIKLDQSPSSSGGNPGGREFRLGVFAAAEVLPVQITSQPNTNQSVFLGSPFSLSVAASGTTPSYQWFQNNAAIAGATNKTFSVTNASTATLGQYYVVLSNSANTVTSSVFTLRSASMLSPTGALYSNIRDDSHFDANYGAANMFEHDMSGVPVGTFLETDAVEFARQGDGSSFVAFDLDQVYANIGSVLFAPRYGSQDQIYRMSIWTSETQSFEAADPGTAPQTVVPILSNAGAYWNQYSMTNTLTGRYFLLKFEEAPGSIGHAGNPGGREFRLGLFSAVTPANVVWSKTSSGMVLNWTGGTLMQADTLAGPWVPAAGITSGVPFPTQTGTRFYRIQY